MNAHYPDRIFGAVGLSRRPVPALLKKSFDKLDKPGKRARLRARNKTLELDRPVVHFQKIGLALSAVRKRRDKRKITGLPVYLPKQIGKTSLPSLPAPSLDPAQGFGYLFPKRFVFSAFTVLYDTVIKVLFRPCLTGAAAYHRKFRIGYLEKGTSQHRGKFDIPLRIIQHLQKRNAVGYLGLGKITRRALTVHRYPR